MTVRRDYTRSRIFQLCASKQANQKFSPPVVQSFFFLHIPVKWTLALFFVFLSFDPLIEVIKVKVRDGTDYSRKENFVRW